MGGRSALGFVLLGALVVAACSEPEPEEGATATTDVTSTGAEVEADTVLARHQGEEWFLGPLPDEPVDADADAEPIVIGLINQEDTPLGSFPEIRRAVEGGVEFINAELGGIDGRRLELHTCVTSFSPEQSAACAQEMEQLDVVALVGGLDVTSNGSIPVLEQNGIAQVGGIPANLVEQQSDVTFFFSGGVTGALAAFLAHVADDGGDEAVLAYGEFESFAVAANDYARPVAEHLGVQLETVSYPITSTDFLPVLTRAAENEPDAIIMAAAGAACAPIMQTYKDLGIAAQLYLVGACADDEIIRAADGAHEGVIFNSEGPPAGDDDVDGGIYASINELYSDEEGGGAGTVGMRSVLNLYAVLTDLGADGISREAVLDELRSSVDRPGFWGHSYTCDGNQVSGLPSLCAPQQSLIRVEAPGDVVTLNEEWYDTVELFSRAL
ncbi:MAG: ABC transporter substrate-binding protein [Acidimicrobiales bacterium]